MVNITGVACTINASVLTVAVTWDTTDNGALTIYDASGTAVPGTVTSSGGGFANWQPNTGAMIPGQPYWAQVVVAQVPSVKVAMLWAAPSNVASSYDNGQITLSWTAPTGLPTPGNYNITISDGSATQMMTSTGTKAIFAPSSSLNPATAWTISVQPSLGPSTGPTASGSVVTVAVAVQSVVCTAAGNNAGQIAIMPVTTAYTSFGAILRQNGMTILSQTLSYTPGTPMVLPIPAPFWPLSPVGGYDVVLRAVSGSATGPHGTGLPVVATAPTITMAAVTGGNSPIVAITVALPPGAPAATGFSVVVTTDNTTAGNGTFIGTSGPVTLSGALGGKPYTLAASAMIGSNSTGPVAQVTLLTTAPAITAVDTDAGMVATTFSANGIATVQVDLFVGGITTASAQTSSSPMRLPAPAPAVPFSVSARAALPGLLGPASGPVATLCEPPAAQGVSFDLAGAATLAFAAPAALPAPGGYTIETYDGGTLLASGTAASSPGSLPLTGMLAGGSITARVRATATDATTQAKLSGPRSRPVPVLFNTPGAINAAYDGATATLLWTPPAGPQVDGYLVTLTDSAGGVATATQRVSDVSLSLGYDAKPASVVTVAVQATGADAIGRAITAPLFTPALFASSDTTKAAYLAPSASLNFIKQPLAIFLPALLAAPQSPLPSNASFVLATTSTAPWTYLLTVNQTDAVWSFDASAIRPALLADITDFMAKMATQGLTAQGDLLLRQVFSRILPMTFIEMLFYGYNFNSADGGAGQSQGLVDLTPGMALRVEVQSYEMLPTSTAAGNAGMVGNAVFDYDIGGYHTATAWRQGFEAFLSRLVGHGVIFPGPKGGTISPAQTGAGGAPDFYYPNFLQPYYRLIYPPTFMSSIDCPVSQNLRDNVTLIAASTRALLDQATEVLRNPQVNFQPVNALYFRGRALISPRIHVLLNGNDITVPLGSTVSNLLERFAALPAAGGRCAQLRVRRGLEGVAIQGWPATLTAAVRLDWTGGCTWGDGTSWLDLPLLRGDRVDIDLG